MPDFVAVTVDSITFVSIYRAPGSDVRPLPNLTPSSLTIAAGDFDVDHPEWQTLANSLHGDGQIITEWMQVNKITLASRPGVPTHD